MHYVIINMVILINGVAYYLVLGYRIKNEKWIKIVVKRITNHDSLIVFLFWDALLHWYISILWFHIWQCRKKITE